MNMLFSLRAVFQVPLYGREIESSKERANEDRNEMRRCEFEDMTRMTRDVTELLILL
jgi:hypothetical protein